MALGYMDFINDKVYLDGMKIRDAQEGKEHRYTDDGEEIVCPVCGAVWLQEVEGEYPFGTCDHLQFSLHSDCGDDLEFFNK